MGAARRNGRFDRAYPLAAEMVASVVELPNGVLAVPRLFSSLSDAPLLGEAAILWQLSIQPEKGFPFKEGGGIPACVYVVLVGMFALGAWRILESIMTFRAMRGEEVAVPAPPVQAVLWIGLVLGAVAAVWTRHYLIGAGLVIVALILPIERRKAPKGVEDWPEPAVSGKPADGDAGKRPAA